MTKHCVLGLLFQRYRNEKEQKNRISQTLEELQEILNQTDPPSMGDIIRARALVSRARRELNKEN